jgi:hypothetical protein
MSQCLPRGDVGARGADLRGHSRLASARGAVRAAGSALAGRGRRRADRALRRVARPGRGTFVGAHEDVPRVVRGQERGPAAPCAHGAGPRRGARGGCERARLPPPGGHVPRGGGGQGPPSGDRSGARRALAGLRHEVDPSAARGRGFQGGRAGGGFARGAAGPRACDQEPEAAGGVRPRLGAGGVLLPHGGSIGVPRGCSADCCAHAPHRTKTLSPRCARCGGRAWRLCPGR